MYSVFYGDQLIFETGRKEIPIEEPHLFEKENRAPEFSFSIPAENQYADILEARKEEIVLYDTDDGIFTDDKEIFRGKIVSITGDFYNTKKVECIGALSYLSDSIQRQSEHHNQTVAQFLSFLLEKHNEQVSEEEKIYMGAVTVHDGNDSIYRYTNYETTLECISDKLVEPLGGRVVIRRNGGKNYLDYLSEYLNTSSQPIEFGKNMLDFSKNTDASEIYTVCIPLGARLDESPIEALDAYLTIESVNNGKDYLENTEAIAVYGRRVKVVNFDDVTLPENLKTKGERWLTNNQYENISLTVDAIDLAMIDTDFERFKLGDQVRVYSRPHGLNRYFPITERDRYLDNPEKNTITLGKNMVGGIVGAIQSSQQTTKESFSKISSTNSVLEMARHNATELINLATNGNVKTTANEQLIMDTLSIETATRLWRWNLNGLGYSKNGYEGPYETALTMDGTLVADFIVAAKLIAGTVGGWKISDNAIYSDFTSNDGAVYRVYIQGFLDLYKENSWIYSVQKSTDGGKSFGGLMYIRGDGKISTPGIIGSLAVESNLSAIKISCGGDDAYVGSVLSVFGSGTVKENFNVYGTFYAASGNIAASDERIKDDIAELDKKESSEFINRLRPISFRYIDGESGREHHGFGAAAVKEAMKEKDWGLYCEVLVPENEREGTEKRKKIKALRYDEIIADLVAMVQFHDERIAKLEERWENGEHS